MIRPTHPLGDFIGVVFVIALVTMELYFPLSTIFNVLN